MNRATRNELSRRTVVGALAASSVMPVAGAAASSTVDSTLVDLGRQFDQLAKYIDDPCGEGGLLTEDFFAKFHKTEADILSTPAKTIDGYRVKARAACWALLGDIDQNAGSTTDERMALSIVRDLIQQYDPELEKPGALQELVSRKS